jgi:radical SAM PhpK family P-methyltransferase
MIDCLIIGFNDYSFEDFVKMLRAMGEKSGAYRDLNLAFIDYENKPHHSLDLLNHFYFAGQGETERRFHNSDFLWPVITYLSTYLHRRGFSFDYVNLFQLEKEVLKEKLRNEEVLSVAITTTLYVSPHPILEIISFIKQYNERAKIILGGPYVSNQSKIDSPADLKRLFRHLGADFYVISSEGEAGLAGILNALKTGAGFDSVDNIAYRNGSDFVFTSAAIESNPLEENMVDYSLFPRNGFGGFVTLRTAKSCPFSCSFCGFPQRAGKYTYLPLPLVEAELNAISDLGTVHTLTFIDDTFNVPKGRFKDILRLMIRNKYEFRWNSYLRSDHVDEEAIELMAASGCDGVFLGVESGSDIMLERMNKTSRRKDYLRVIPQLRDAGIISYASLIIGFPGETYETVRDTAEFVETARPDFFRAQLWYCDPTTPIWHEREKYRIQGSAFNWTHDSMDAATACDLIDKTFLSINNSVWLPQNGFELWSVYYLLRKGMALEQIKTFLRFFNGCVKEKLIYEGARPADSGLIEGLKVSSRFNERQRPDMSPINLLAGSGYQGAERCFISQLRDYQPFSSLEFSRGQRADADDGWESVSCSVNAGALARLRDGFEGKLAAVNLAALSILLSRLSGKTDTLIVAVLEQDSRALAAPVRLLPHWDLTFRGFVESVDSTLTESMSHSLYAFTIVTNSRRLAEHGCMRPVLDIGFAFDESGKKGEDPGFGRALEYYPEVKNGIELVVETNGDSPPNLWFAAGRFRKGTVEQLALCLASILNEAAANFAVRLEYLGLGGEATAVPASTAKDESEVFSF